MGTAWIFRVLLLVGAIVQCWSTPTNQILKMTTSTIPTLQLRRFNTTKLFKKNTWIPLTSDTPYDNPVKSPVSSTLLPPPNVVSHRAVPRSGPYHITPLTASPNNWSNFLGNPPLQHNPLTADIVTSDTSQLPGRFFKIGTNIRVMNDDSYTTSSSDPKITDSNAQSSAINTANFQYPGIPVYNQQFADSSGLSPNVLPTFSSSLENNLGKFEPFPPFKYSRSNFQFPGVHQALPIDPIVSSLEFNGRSNPKVNFGLENDNFMVRHHSPFIYFNNHKRGQVLPLHFLVRPTKFQRFKGLDLNTFNGRGIGKPNESYQPLSGQPQLHFSPLQQPIGNSQAFGKIRGSGEVVNQIDVNQSGGRGQHGSGEGAIKNSYTVGNSGNIHPVTSFGNGDSFELPASSAFNDYDKSFGKYTTGSAAPPPRGNVIKQYHHAPVTGTNEQEKDGNDEKSEYRSEEEESNSRERNNDEEESESQYEERRENTRNGQKKNYGDDLEKEFEDSYRQGHPPEEFEHSEEILEVDEPERNNKNSSLRTRNSPRKSSSHDRKRYYEKIEHKRTSQPVHESQERCGKDTHDSHESRNYRRDEPPPKKSYGHKISRRRPSYDSNKKGTLPK